MFLFFAKEFMIQLSFNTKYNHIQMYTFMNTINNNGFTKKPGQNQNRAHHIVKT
jgi:hypothetical protein